MWSIRRGKARHTPTATVDLREGGKFSSRMEAKDGSMGFDFAGTYTKIVKHKLIEYSFGLKRNASSPEPSTGTRLAFSIARSRAGTRCGPIARPDRTERPDLRIEISRGRHP